MKRVMITFVVLAFASGLALGQTGAAQAGKTHDVTGEVVKADATAKTITLKVDGKDATMKVEGEAVNILKDLKAGEKVTVSCRDDASGAHQAITKIVKAKAT